MGCFTTLGVWVCVVMSQVQICTGFITITTVKSDDDIIIERYGSIVLGAHPGTTVMAQFIFDNLTAHKIPYNMDIQSATSQRVGQLTIWDYLYFTGQTQLVPVALEVSTTVNHVVINLHKMRKGFCYEYHYATERLYLDMACPAVIEKHSPRGVYDVQENVWTHNKTIPVSFSFNAVHSTGACVEPKKQETHANIIPGVSLDLPCNDTTYSQLASNDHKLHVYYNTSAQKMTIYGPRSPDDYIDSVGTITILVLTLCVWLYWMHDLHARLRQAIQILHTPNPTYITAAIQTEQTLTQLYNVPTIWEDILGALNGATYNHIHNMEREKLTQVPHYDRYIYISMQNQAIWRVITYYQIVLLDVVILVASTIFMHSFRGRAALYTEEAVALVGDTFVCRYLVWWAVLCSFVLPLLVCMITVYGTIGSMDETSIETTRLRRWFSWGYDDLLTSVWSRLLVNMSILSIGSTAMYYIGYFFFGSTTIGTIGVVMLPVLILIGSNWYKIQAYLCVFFPVDTMLLLFLRWMVEVLILTTIHMELPSEIDRVYASNYRNAIGLSAGVAILMITGRDLTWILLLYHYQQPTHTLKFILVLLSLSILCGAMLTHTTIFMIGPIFMDSSSLQYYPTGALCTVLGFGMVVLSLATVWSAGTFYRWTHYTDSVNNKQK
jgi:hypothetical protein